MQLCLCPCGCASNAHVCACVATISDKSSWNAHLTTPCFTFKFKKKIQHPPFPPFNVDLTFRIAAANVCSNVGHVFPSLLTTLKWGRGAPRNEPSFQQFCQ